MPSASSVIRVSIIGDARKLTAALGQADKATGGLLKSTAVAAGSALVAYGAVREGTEFLSDSIQEFDRLQDATFNLTAQLGDLAGPLVEAADGFAKLGGSKQDVIEMEARFADLATSIGIADPLIANFADDVAATALAMALLSDSSPDEILDQIAKAAGGSARAAKELGVSLDSTLSPAQQLDAILAQLKPKLDAATTGSGDLEQKQAELQARVETLQAQVGEGLTPAFAGLLEITLEVLDELGDWPGALQDIGNAFIGFARTALGPLGNVADALGGINDLIGSVGRGLANIGGGGGSNGGFINERDLNRTQSNIRERNGGGP